MARPMRRLANRGRRALLDGVVRLETSTRRPIPPRPLHARRVARHGPALGRRRMLDEGMHYARDLAPDRREHGDHHPDRLLAPSRRGWLPPMLDRLARRARAGSARTRPDRAMTDRLRLAVPNKGRLVEPTLALLHDAGLVFDEHDRSLVARVQNFDLDILFVRDERHHRVRRRRRGRPRGSPAATSSPRQVRSCRASATSATGGAAWRRPSRRFDVVRGRRGPGRPPRRHRAPEPARRFFADGRIGVDVIPISGAVEVAPRLGLAEAIVDLVSTGSTLVMNGLRPIGDVSCRRRSWSRTRRARHRAGEIRAIDTMLGAVIAARGGST